MLWSAFGNVPVPDPGFTKDKNLVFAPHIYAESLSSNSIPGGFASAQKVAKQHGVTVWGGEWGFWPEHPVDASRKIKRYAAAEDAGQYGGAWWDWKQACGDPHVVNQPGGQPSAVSGSLNRFTCPDQVMSAPDPAFADVLSRPVPRAVPGTITRLTSDGRTGKLVLAGKHTDGRRPVRAAGLRAEALRGRESAGHRHRQPPALARARERRAARLRRGQVPAAARLGTRPGSEARALAHRRATTTRTLRT